MDVEPPLQTQKLCAHSLSLRIIHIVLVAEIGSLEVPQAATGQPFGNGDRHGHDTAIRRRHRCRQVATICLRLSIDVENEPSKVMLRLTEILRRLNEPSETEPGYQGHAVRIVLELWNSWLRT